MALLSPFLICGLGQTWLHEWQGHVSRAESGFQSESPEAGFKDCIHSGCPGSRRGSDPALCFLELLPGVCIPVRRRRLSVLLHHLLRGPRGAHVWEQQLLQVRVPRPVASLR